MKVIQIAPVVEYSDTGNEDNGTWQRYPNSDATLYGLGDDGKPYIWCRTKTTQRELAEPDEEGNTYHYEHEYGWVAA